MKKLFGLVSFSGILISAGMVPLSLSAQTKQSLFLAYPPPEHQTSSEKIFLIGTASPEGKVKINGKTVERSPTGHFAPSFPLEIGDNFFTLRHKEEEIELKVTRVATEPEIPEEVAFANNSLTPGVSIARLPGELICFGAVATPNADVSVRLRNQHIALLPQTEFTQLPANSAVLTAANQPTIKVSTGTYKGCTTLAVGNWGKPEFKLNFQGKTVTQAGIGEIEILSPTQLEVVEVIADAGVARTGASTNYSRLTPLPKGTRASVTGKEGEWLRLDYGAWIKAEETQPVATNVPPASLIRSVTSRQVGDATEIIFPLQVPVPVSVRQGDSNITLTLYNTTAQTDTIRLDDDPLIKRLDWQQVTPNKIEYTFQLKTEQQFGYDLSYEGTSLIFTLHHPPKMVMPRDNTLLPLSRDKNNSLILERTNSSRNLPLSNIRILLDPGHGGEEKGSRGPTGYPEKDVNLVVSKLLAKELKRLGATVYLTRETDIDVSLKDRVKTIDEIEPDLALSIHYNALPDNGDAINTKGISTFWYNTQAHNVAVFLHNYLVEKLDRADAGVFWNNLALTRPHTAPSVLLELGFMINPWEFEWITNPEEQTKLARAIADGIVEWFAGI
ncbi:MAG: N-acetylmuramoyl-L-alanine amidase [Xenococcaceae cyanobacterium MO_188.B32]|nr:N-acetylmuramoyl-L-alanine amidase [Xenococcaceae cyanobacterium MO_188.B32]